MKQLDEPVAASGRQAELVAGVVVCPNLAHPDNLHLVAARLRNAVAQPVRLSAGETLVPRLSLGATLTAAGHTADSALHRTDDAMYQAKRALSHFRAS